MELLREEGGVRLFLEWRRTDGVQPVRRLYWLCAEAPPDAWQTQFDPDVVERWLTMAVPSEFPGGDRRVWRQTSRYALVRVRNEPGAIGVNASVLPKTTWEKI